MTVPVYIYSDPICPWCYIGKTRFDRVRELRPELQLELHWRIFQLNPEMPAEGMERQDYLDRKFGGRARSDQVYSHINTVGRSEGIDFRFDLIRKTPNTLNAHRLIRYVSVHSFADVSRLMDRMFQAYFLEGLDLGSVDILVGLVDDLDIKINGLEDYLGGNTDVDACRMDDLVARRQGIVGVPYFIVDGRMAISGAQDPSFFVPLLDAAAQNKTTP